MAKIVITIEDEAEDAADEVSAEAVFDPELPMKDGKPDMEAATGAQQMACIMLMSARDHARLDTVRRVEGTDVEGRERVVGGG